MAGPLISQLEEDDAEKTALEHIETIRNKLREAQKVDLAFLLDATSSMGPFITVVKEKIVEIAEGVKKAFPEEGELRVACAFYRDYDADEDIGLDSTSGKPRYQRSGICCPFTRDVRVLQKQLEGLEAWGGGDDAEDVFSGLEQLLNLDWTAPATRLVYHIADAPCHGRRFHDLQYAEKCPDTAYKSERFKSMKATPEGDPEGRQIENILSRLAESAKIWSYTFLHIHDQKGQRPKTAKMLEEFRKANDNIPSGMKMEEHVVEVPAHARGRKKGEASSARISEVVRDGVKNTVNSSMNDLVNKPSPSVVHIYAEICVDDRIPTDWGTLNSCRVFFYRPTKYETIDEMLTQIEQGAPLGFRMNKGGPFYVRIAEHPFSKACVSRWPFYANIQVDTTSSKPSPPYVIKKFKSVDYHDVKDYANPFKNPYLEVMETYAIASQLVTHFFTEIKNKGALDRAKLLSSDTSFATCKVVGSTECFNVETFHSNAHAQWLDVNERSEYYETLQAFSHWTNECSDDFLMVIVPTLILKGGTSKAMLCDPAIHCKKYPHRFKRTNKGEIGINRFYSTHKVCNDLCKALGLKPRK